VTRLRVEWFWVRLLAGVKGFSLLQYLLICSGADQTYGSVGTRVPYREMKWPERETGHFSTSAVKVKNQRGHTPVPPYSLMAFAVATITLAFILYSAIRNQNCWHCVVHSAGYINKSTLSNVRTLRVFESASPVFSRLGLCTSHYLVWLVLMVMVMFSMWSCPLVNILTTVLLILTLLTPLW
jgi:hypothetical protein